MPALPKDTYTVKAKLSDAIAALSENPVQVILGAASAVLNNTNTESTRNEEDQVRLAKKMEFTPVAILVLSLRDPIWVSSMLSWRSRMWTMRSFCSVRIISITKWPSRLPAVEP